MTAVPTATATRASAGGHRNPYGAMPATSPQAARIAALG